MGSIDVIDSPNFQFLLLQLINMEQKKLCINTIGAQLAALQCGGNGRASTLRAFKDEDPRVLPIG